MRTDWERPRFTRSAHPSTQETADGHARVAVRHVALAMVAGGIVTFLVPVAMIAYNMWQENRLTQSWQRAVGTPTVVAGAPGVVAGAPGVVVGTSMPDSPAAAATAGPTSRSAVGANAVPALFAIDVPRINYYAAVRQGVSLGILASGPGHYPTTAMPGQPGLVGVAAHNTFWIPFGELGPGDTVILQTSTASFIYRITDRKIVNPNDNSVLLPTSTPSLVLTTCWPLWAGDLATQRLVFVARQV